MAFVAVAGRREHETIAGSACDDVDPPTKRADVAHMIHSDWQGCGLGTLLQECLVDDARSQGLRGFAADVLVANAKVIRVFERSRALITKKVNAGRYEVKIIFD